MKFVGYITLRMNSTRIPNKVIQKVGTRTLVDRGIRCLTGVHDINQVVVYASHPAQYLEYLSTAPSEKVLFVERPKRYDGNFVTFNNILDSIIDTPPISEAEYIVFYSVTSPFVTSKMVHYMIEAMRLHKKDSAFLATTQQSFAWYKGKPLYHLKNVPRTQDLPQLIIETSSCYIFQREFYKRTGRRIGNNPFVLTIDKHRGLDIDTINDLELAKNITNIYGW